MTSIFSSLEATASTSGASHSSTISSSLSSDARASPTQSSQSNSFPFSHSTSTSTNDARTSSSTPTSSTAASATITSPSPSATSSGAGQHTNSGLITGIAVAVAVGALALLGVIFFYCCWRRRRGRRRSEDDDEGREPMKPSPITRTSALRPLSLCLPLASPITTRSGTRSLWGNNSKSDELLPTSTLHGSQNSIGCVDTHITKPAPILPISEPIQKELQLDEPKHHEPILSEPLLNRPVASEQTAEAPKPLVVLDQGPGVLPEPQATQCRPVSETTTIATSSEVQTPKRPPIAIQRPFSTATSAATSFEEDWELQVDDDVPPLPAIPDTQLIRTLSAKRSYERPTRLDLVARDDSYYGRPLNSVLETPMYDNGNVILPSKKMIRSMGRPQLSILKGGISQKPHLADLVASDVTSAGILFDESSRATPSSMSPPTPYDIPLRNSSIAKTYMDPRKGSVRSFLMESSSEDSTSDRAIKLFPKPLSFRRRFGSPALGTSIQNLTYPVVPPSASESGRPTKRPSFSFEFPIKLKSVSEASTVDDAEESPLLPCIKDNPSIAVDQLKIVDHDNELGISGLNPRTEAYASRSARPSDFVPLDDYLTPKRTQSSDLIDSQFVMVTLQDQRP